MSNNVRVPPPNGLLYPENFKKRKVIARVFVKSRRQKPNYYESLTPSYRPIGYKTGCDIETMKGKSKPVFTFEESEIPGVKVIKGK